MLRPSLRVILVASLAVGASGCKKEEDRAPEPLAAPAAEPPKAEIAPAAEPPPAATETASAAPEPAASAAAPAAATPAQPAATKPKTTTATATAKDAGTKPVADAGATGRVAVNPGAQSIQRCCSALQAAAQKGGTPANKYKSAAAVCQGIAAAVAKGTANADAARTTIRAQLQGVAVPPEC